MRSFIAAVVVALALAASAQGFVLRQESTAVTSAPTTNITTNICDLDWYYCPRDPGCITYTMSAHTVRVNAAGYSEPVKASKLSPGHMLTVEVLGETTMTEVPTAGSYRIYALNGKNMAAGVLSDALTLNGANFILEISFELTSDAIGSDGWFEFGIDVFQQKSGSDEGFCLEIASVAYTKYEEDRNLPPFVMECKDEGNGHFIKDVHTIVPKAIPSPSCSGPSTCDLKYFYCPRDPGCVTYTMSASVVEVDVLDANDIKPGDHLRLTVNGTTQIKTVPVDGSYRIYDIAGHNVVGGALTDAMTIYECVEEGCYFGVVVDFVLPAAAFTEQGWMEFGLDVFQKSSGSDEGFCVEVANQAYVTYEQTHPQPPPGFDTYCKDEGWGHFKKETIPEIIWDAKCVLEG